MNSSNSNQGLYRQSDEGSGGTHHPAHQPGKTPDGYGDTPSGRTTPAAHTHPPAAPHGAPATADSASKRAESNPETHTPPPQPKAGQAQPAPAEMGHFDMGGGSTGRDLVGDDSAPLPPSTSSGGANS